MFNELLLQAQVFTLPTKNTKKLLRLPHKGRKNRHRTVKWPIRKTAYKRNWPVFFYCRNRPPVLPSRAPLSDPRLKLKSKVTMWLCVYCYRIRWKKIETSYIQIESVFTLKLKKNQLNNIIIMSSIYTVDILHINTLSKCTGLFFYDIIVI